MRLTTEDRDGGPGGERDRRHDASVHAERRPAGEETGPELLTRFLDRLQGAGLDRATAHVAWHAVLTIVLGSLPQDLALSTEQGTAFDAVLELAITGLATAAAQPPSARATALLNAHRL